MRIAVAFLLLLLIVPGWSGDERLALPGKGFDLRTVRVALDPERPGRTEVGRLTFLGGVTLASDDPAFGGFSALSVAGDRFTLVSDGGNLLRFRMTDDWRPSEARFDPLPAGPGTGWRKEDRDAEALAIDPATGTAWIAFENANAIWRYDREFKRAEAHRVPRVMRRWAVSGGAESMTRLRDGRFVAIAEAQRPLRGPKGAPGATRVGVVFAGDPTDPATRVTRFIYRTRRGFDPADVAELPDGRLLVVERAFGLPFEWTNRLAIVRRGAIREGEVVTGRVVARLAAPLVHDNFEGIAATTENGATILWLLSDDNQFPLQRTLLLKFRLNG